MKVFLYKLFYYNVPFEKGWTYRRISGDNLDIFAAYGTLLLSLGWERVSDPSCGLLKVHCWYRKPYKK